MVDFITLLVVIFFWHFHIFTYLFICAYLFISFFILLVAVQKKKKIFKKTKLFCVKNQKIISKYSASFTTPVFFINKISHVVCKTNCLIYILSYFSTMMLVLVLVYIALNIEEILLKLDVLLRDGYFM